MARITKERYGFTLTYFDASGIKQKETQLTMDQAGSRYKDIKENIPEAFAVNGDDTVESFLKNYIRYIPKDIPSKQYQRRYGLLNNYIATVISDQTINAIDMDQASEIISHLQTLDGVGTKTIPKETFYRSYRLIQDAFEYLYINEVIDLDPFASIYIPKPKEKAKSNEWTLDDFKRITSQCTDTQMFIYLHLLFCTGCSITELLGLQIEDVHVAEDNIQNDDCWIECKYIYKRFNKECINQKERENIIASFEEHENGKTTLVLMKKDQKKTIPIPAQVGTLIHEWISSASYIYENPNLELHPLFINTDGTPLEDCMLTKRFRKLTDDRSLSLNGLKTLGSKQTALPLGKVYYCTHETITLPASCRDQKQFHDRSTKVLALSAKNEFESSLPDKTMANITSFANRIKRNPELRTYLESKVQGV